MVANLNNIIKSDLESRGLIPTESLTKTIWQIPVSWRSWVGAGHYYAWICDVHENYVEVYSGNVPSHDFPIDKTEKFHATDPLFLDKVFQAIDKALNIRSST